MKYPLPDIEGPLRILFALAALGVLALVGGIAWLAFALLR